MVSTHQITSGPMAHTDDKNGVRAAEMPKVTFQGVEYLFPGPVSTAVRSQELLDKMIEGKLPETSQQQQFSLPKSRPRGSSCGNT